MSTFISGHVHTFELITYSSGNGPRVLVSDSGVELSSGVPTLSNGKLWAGSGSLPLSTLNSLTEWGYGVLNSQGSRLNVFLSDGASALKCSIGATSASCK